jgi:hypothetical protein
MRATIAAAAAVVVVGGASAAPAQADTAAVNITSGASAYAGAAATGSATLGANLQLSGALGKLLDALISPIVNDSLSPLLSALQGTVNSAANGLLGSSSLLNAATSPSQAQYGTAPAAFPADSLPSPCVSSGSQPCFTGPGVNLNVPPLVNAQIGALNGYAEQVATSADATNPIFGRSAVAGINLSLLPLLGTLIPGLPSVGNPLVSTGVIQSKANCPNDGAAGATKPKTAPSIGISTTGVTLLGGLITLDVLNGQIANLNVNGTTYAGITSLPTLNISGITVSSYGTALMVSIPLSLGQILTALQIPSTVANSLTALGLNSTLALRLIVGPNSTLTNRTASAWGLGVSADLSGSLSFNLLNLVVATINVPTGITGSNLGNVLDLRLAYSTCQSGVVMPATVPAIPPTLV